MAKQYRITLFSAPGQAVPYLMTGRARGLDALGHKTQLIDLASLGKKSAQDGGRQAMEGLIDSIRAFAPDAFFFYGATALIPVAAAPGRTVPLLSLFEKPMVSFYTCSDLEFPGRLRELGQGCADSRFFVFTYDSFQYHLLKNMGMKNRCALLDLASDPELFRPMGQKQAAAALGKQGFDIPETGIQTSFTANFRNSGGLLPELGEDFEPALRHTALITAEKTGWHRLRWIKPMADMPLSIFGAGWEKAGDRIAPQWSLMPFCPYPKLPLVYSASEINVNVTAPEMADSYPTRVFDVMAAGGLMITDRRDCAYRLFRPGTDMIAANSPQDLRTLVRELLTDKARAQEIRYNARKSIIERHSWRVRMREALEILESKGLLG